MKQHINTSGIKFEIREMRMILRIQYWLLIALMVLALVWVFLMHGSIYEPNPMKSLRLSILNTALLLVFSVISFFMRRFLIQNMRHAPVLDLQWVKKYRNHNFIRAALFETIFFLSLLIFLFWGQTFSLILAVVAILMLVFYYPGNYRLRTELRMKEEDLE